MSYGAIVYIQGFGDSYSLEHYLTLNEGLYLTQGGINQSVDMLTKEDLLNLIAHIFKEQMVELDEYEGIQIDNPAHWIICKCEYDNIIDLRPSKFEFLDVVETFCTKSTSGTKTTMNHVIVLTKNNWPPALIL